MLKCWVSIPWTVESTSISTTTSKRYLLVTVVGHLHHHDNLRGRQHRLQTGRQWAAAVLVLRERQCFCFGGYVLVVTFWWCCFGVCVGVLLGGCQSLLLVSWLVLMDGGKRRGKTKRKRWVPCVNTTTTTATTPPPVAALPVLVVHWRQWTAARNSTTTTIVGTTTARGAGIPRSLHWVRTTCSCRCCCGWQWKEKWKWLMSLFVLYVRACEVKRQCTVVEQ